MSREETRERQKPLSKILWFIALWAAGVAAIGAVGYAVRLVIGP